MDLNSTVYVMSAFALIQTRISTINEVTNEEETTTTPLIVEISNNRGTDCAKSLTEQAQSTDKNSTNNNGDLNRQIVSRLVDLLGQKFFNQLASFDSARLVLSLDSGLLSLISKQSQNKPQNILDWRDKSESKSPLGCFSTNRMDVEDQCRNSKTRKKKPSESPSSREFHFSDGGFHHDSRANLCSALGVLHDHF